MLIVQYSCSKSGVIPSLLSPVATEQEIACAIEAVSTVIIQMHSVALINILLDFGEKIVRTQKFGMRY